MKKLYIYIILSAVLILSVYTYNNKIKNSIIEKDYSIILRINCNLCLEVNEMLLSDAWEKNIDQKTRIQNILDIVYKSAHKGSNYEIKDKTYINLFTNLNYFEEYVYEIKRTLRDSYLSDKEKHFIEKSNETLIQINNEIDKDGAV